MSNGLDLYSSYQRGQSFCSLIHLEYLRLILPKFYTRFFCFLWHALPKKILSIPWTMGTNVRITLWNAALFITTNWSGFSYLISNCAAQILKRFVWHETSNTMSHIEFLLTYSSMTFVFWSYLALFLPQSHWLFLPQPHFLPSAISNPLSSIHSSI